MENQDKVICVFKKDGENINSKLACAFEDFLIEFDNKVENDKNM